MEHALSKHETTGRIEWPFDTAIILRLAKGIIKGLKSLHNAGMLHLDMKPHNVLLRLPPGSDGDLKSAVPVIMDLGSCKRNPIKVRSRKHALIFERRCRDQLLCALPSARAMGPRVRVRHRTRGGHLVARVHALRHELWRRLWTLREPRRGRPQARYSQRVLRISGRRHQTRKCSSLSQRCQPARYHRWNAPTTSGGPNLHVRRKKYNNIKIQSII